ncbi:MAG: ECF transporter S component [Lachnospiraceae bacterium]
MGRNLTLKITFSAVAAALTFVATVFIRVPSVDGGYTNLSDAIIFLRRLCSDVPAMLAGGLGTFFADLYVYPATMFYSLVIHGLEGLFCGLLLKLIHSKCRNSKLEPLLGGAAMALCGLFMAGMYFLANGCFTAPGQARW